MTKKSNNEKMEKGWSRVKKILYFNRRLFAAGAITAFVAVGLLALSPAAIPVAIIASLPGGMTALGVNVVSALLLKAASEDALTDEQLLQEIQEIIDDKKILSKDDFYSYMSAYYPKLLDIKDTVDSLPTIECIQNAMKNAMTYIVETVGEIDDVTKVIEADVVEIKKTVDELRRSYLTNKNLDAEKLRTANQQWEYIQDHKIQKLELFFSAKRRCWSRMVPRFIR